MMDSMFKGSGLNLIIEINHNHGGLVVVEGDEISHEQHLIVRWLILTEFRFFLGFSTARTPSSAADERGSYFCSAKIATLLTVRWS